jgi:Ion channel
MGREQSRLLGAARGKFGYLLLALIVFLATAPVIAESHARKLVLAGFGSGLLIAGLHAARPGKRSLIVGLVVAAVEFGIGQMAEFHGSRWLTFAQALLWLLAMTYVAVEILEKVLGSAEVTLETLQAAFCVYLLLGLIWAFLYTLVQHAAPASFQMQHGPPVDWSDASSRRLGFLRLFIFSYSTLTATGYGDIVPAGAFAQMAACLEAMTAQVFLAVVIARLVGIQASPPPTVRADAPLDEPGFGGD